MNASVRFINLATADGLVWLYQSLDRNSTGLHTFRVADRGIQVFPLFYEIVTPAAFQEGLA